MSNMIPFSSSMVPDYIREEGQSELTKSLMQRVGNSVKRVSIKGGKFRLIVGGEEVARLPAGQPLDVIIVNTNTYWKEYLPYGTGGAYKPRVFASEAEAKAAGLSTEYTQDRSAPRASRAMTLRLLIKKPADVSCAYFAAEFGGSLWAPARWAVDKTAYTKVSAKLDSIVGTVLRNKNLLYGSWSLSTDTEKRGPNTVIIPSLKYVGVTPQAVVDDVLKLFNSSKA